MQLAIGACALALLACSATPVAAMARPPHLGTPGVITSFAGESNLLATSSVAGHPDAYAVFHRKIGANIYSVVHRDAHGHAHRFDIPTTSGSFPEAIRIVALEAGGGMAIWDESRSHRVLARSWQRDGTLGATQVVMSQITTVHSADFDSAQWRVRADGKGTVVVATTPAGPNSTASVVAAVRDPGGPFEPQQGLTLAAGPAGEPAVDEIRISPIATDGSVVIAWGPDGGGSGGRATRAGRATSFGAPEAHPFTSEVGLSATNLSIVAQDGTPITISAALARTCPCIQPQVFAWSGGVRVLVFQTYSNPLTYEVGSWHVAHPDARGVFVNAVEAIRNGSSSPVRRARPGEVGFARFDTSTDDDLFRERSRLIVIPFGPTVPRSRRAARLGFGSFAWARAGHLLVPVYCDRVCRVHGSSDRVARLPVTDSQGKHADARLEPFSVVYLRVPLTGRGTAHISFGATDDAGHHSAARATFVRSSRAGQWCRAGASHC